MASSPLKRLVRNGFRFGVSGRFFRILAPQSPPASPGKPHKLAIVDMIPHLGDKVMIFPLIDALRRENTDLEISYFTSSGGRQIESHPHIDHVYAMPQRSKGGTPVYPLFFLSILRWWNRDLRPLRFHTVVVLRGGVEPFFSHHLAWMLGGNKRVAYSTLLEPEHSESEFGVSPLFTDEVKQMHGVHEVTRGSEVLQLAGLLHHPVDLHQPVESLLTIASSAASQSYLKELGLHNRPYAVVAPGASAKRRAWPADRFGAVVKLELLPRGWLPVVVGGPETAEAAGIIRESAGGQVLNLTGKTTFEQLVAICGHARCFLGNDSGTSHVAGACGTPTVIVTAFAHDSLPTHHASPLRSHPVGPFVAILQPKKQIPPCTTECLATDVHCIGEIGVEQMAEALDDLLGKRAGSTMVHAQIS
jgi:ADP-heptose:LPS heptosyltransferase